MIPDRRASGFALLLALVLGIGASPASAGPLLQIPEFEGLAAKASESVVVTLDSTLLQLAARFLSEDDAEDAEVRKVISGLSGIYVRSFTFDSDFAYPQEDIAALRRQLSAPGWQRLVEVRKPREGTSVDVYLSIAPGGKKANGLAVIASEPREFTIVNIVGEVDLDALHKLEGKFKVPELGIDYETAGAREK